jgi:hypothetical protein
MCRYLYISTYISIYCIYINIYIYVLPFQMENGSPGNFPKSVYHLPSCKFKFVCLFTKKQTEIIRLQMVLTD